MSTDRNARLSADIARVVRGILAERRMSILEFSALVGRPNATVHRWVNGDGKFDTDALEQIADGLGMDAGELVSLAVRKRAERELSGISAKERADLERARESKRNRQSG